MHTDAAGLQLDAGQLWQRLSGRGAKARAAHLYSQFGCRVFQLSVQRAYSSGTCTSFQDWCITCGTSRFSASLANLRIEPLAAATKLRSSTSLIGASAAAQPPFAYALQENLQARQSRVAASRGQQQGAPGKAGSRGKKRRLAQRLHKAENARSSNARCTHALQPAVS